MGRRTLLLLAAVVVAALGTALLFVYVSGINNRALAGQSPERVLVATTTIPVGTTLKDAQSAGDFQPKTLPSDAVAEGALSTVPAALQSEMAITTIVPGQQIVRAEFGSQATSDVLDIKPGMLAVSVQLTDYGRVAGFVAPGSHVAIFLDVSPKDLITGQQLSQEVRTLLPNVEVLAAGPTTITPRTTVSNGQSNTEQISQAILTLEVTQQQAEELVFAQDHATLYFGLLASSSEQIGPGQPVTGSTVVG